MTREPTIYAMLNGHGENTPLYLVLPLGALSRGDAWLDAKDALRNGEKGHWFGPYTEEGTGRQIKVRPAPCGSGCFCAAEYKVIKP